MEHKKLSSLIGLCILVTTSQYDLTTPRPDTDLCCLREVAKDITDVINHRSIASETQCRNLCRSNETCVGVYWRYNNNECFVKTVATGSTVKQWSLINCADGNLTYCWKLQEKVHQNGGIKHNIQNEIACKQHCIQDCGCTGVDWNEQEKQCWVLSSNAYSGTRNHSHNVKHWIIVRNVQRTCDKLVETSPETSAYTETTMNVRESTTESSNSSTAPPSNCTQQETINIVLAALLGVSTLIIIGISIYAVKLKKYCSTQKKVDKVKVVDVAKVVEAKVNDYGEAKEDDDESYIDYQDLRRLENPPTTCEEEGCEYTAMELENMKEMEDDDNIYYNEDQ